MKKSLMVRPVIWDCDIDQTTGKGYTVKSNEIRQLDGLSVSTGFLSFRRCFELVVRGVLGVSAGST